MASRNYFRIEIRHTGLGKYRVIRGSDRHVVEATALAQQRAWNEQHAKKLEIEERRRQRDERQRELGDNVRDAEDRTREAQAEQDLLHGLLVTSLRIKARIDWEKLKQPQPFSQSQPTPRLYSE